MPSARTVGEALLEAVASRGDEVAIATLERSVGYRELERRSAAVAGALCDRGLAPGRSTALIASGIDYIIAYFGIARAGNRAVPIEARFRGEQLRRILASTEVACAIADETGRATLATLAEPVVQLDVAALVAGPPPSRALPDVATTAELCVLFSSGSTGFPKGVVLTNEAAVERAILMARVFGPGKRHLVFTPLAYAYGLIDGTLCPLLHGGRTLLLGQYNPPRFKEMVTRFQPEIVLGVPFLYKHLGSMGTDLLAGLAPETRCLFYTTGEPMPRATASAFHARYGSMIRQSYGLSETSGIAADLHDVEAKPSRVGKLIPGVTIRFVEETAPGVFTDAPLGEVWVKRTRRFMKGYVAGSETMDGRMAEDCYRTGDIGRLDEEGYLELFGRNDDFVSVAGVRIHPAEVENVLLSVPGVLEAAFVCERDAETGQQATRAYVVLDPARPRSTAELEAKLKAELPPSRWPQRIEVSAGLPRTDTGKLVRRLLVERKDERLVASAPVRVTSGAREIYGRLHDVSRNGCMLMLDQPATVGETLLVQLAAHPDVALAGECRSVNAEDAFYRVGIAFELHDRATIEKLIERRAL